MTATPEIKTTVSIPPRRRSAVLEVELADGRIVKAAVNKGAVKLSLKSVGRYASTDALVLPRDAADLDRIADLLGAAGDEIHAQDAFDAADAAEREAAKGN